MRKIYLSLILVFVVFISGCGGGIIGEKTPMDQLNNDGYYHYTNKGLGFGLYLSPSFEKYHVQRKNTENYTDIEIFTPTADTAYYQEIQSYAKPITVRIWNKDYFDSLEEDDDKIVFLEMGRDKKSVYTLKFWENIPNDWENVWTEEMQQGIVDRFEMY